MELNHFYNRNYTCTHLSKELGKVDLFFLFGKMNFTIKIEKLATFVKGDSKAPFSIATTLRCQCD